MPSISVRHNIEVAHRLFLLPGKCENIHGHSMWVQLTIYGHLNLSGILEGLSFGSVKKSFREYLDEEYDHRLLLNAEDPWAQLLRLESQEEPLKLPGLSAIKGDPTTENLARIIAGWSASTFGLFSEVSVQETHVNAATFSAKPTFDGMPPL